MAYNSYYPAGYQPAYYPTQNNAYSTQMSVGATQPTQNGIIWVQGEPGAKSYLVAPNTTVLLMDSESQRFYLKSSDSSGMPMPLRIFEYTEKTPNSAQIQPKTSETIDSMDYVTKREFEAFKAEIQASLKGESDE